ncbi:hypothetical protein Pcinc_011390 [Petrolisthes cinctipes]|uniref:Uncharacterized protein n=1 Tax=Petrolisthes cinctipes TaxID=88211 RepID=A0AAE1G1D4_PETCI|nr:hypothetical protein Pcinc_011390 [Petrolisthes cinctipes]
MKDVEAEGKGQGMKGVKEKRQRKKGVKGKGQGMKDVEAEGKGQGMKGVEEKRQGKKGVKGKGQGLKGVKGKGQEMKETDVGSPPSNTNRANPFRYLTEEDFVKRYRLPKNAVQDLIEAIEPHAPRPNNDRLKHILAPAETCHTEVFSYWELLT